MSPELRRPPVRCLIVSSGLCGLSVVMSSFTSEVWNRSVGVIGLYVLIGIVIFSLAAGSLSPAFAQIVFPEQQSFELQVVHVIRHLLARLQAYIRLLPVRTESGKLSATALFSKNVRRAHRGNLHLEE